MKNSITKKYFTPRGVRWCFFVNASVQICTITHHFKPRIMPIEVVTKEDLMEFRHTLLHDLRSLLHHQPKEQKQWLKSSEVRKLLKISPGTLQNFRINGTLSYTKIGGILFYSYQDIEKLLEKNKVSNL